MQEQLRRHFKMPHLEIYDGSTTLVDYLESFNVLMLFHEATDGVLCRAFYALRKVAKYWYSSMKSNFMHSFCPLN